MTYKKIVWLALLIAVYCAACKDKDSLASEESEIILKQTYPVSEPNDTNQIRCIELSKDGKLLCVGTGICTKANPQGYPGKVFVFNVSSREILKVIKVHNFPIDLITFSSDGKKVASCDNHGNIFLTNLEDCKSIPIYTNPQLQQRYCMKFSSDDTILYVTDDHSVIGIDVHKFNIAKEYKSNTPVYSFAFNRNETELIAGYGFAGEDQKLVKVWSASQNQVIQEFVTADQIDEEAIYGISVLPDGKGCVMRGAMSIYSLDFNDGKYERLFSTSDEQVSGGELTDFDMDNMGQLVALCGYYASGILDVKTKILLYKIDNPQDTNTARRIRFTNKNNELFIGQESNIYLWKPESHKHDLWFDLLSVTNDK